MSLQTKSRLILVQVKIERAKKHLRDLAAELTTFQKTSLTVIGEREDQHGNVVSREFPVYPFNALACAGDIVQNLRTALDHLAWQLVMTASLPGFPPGRHTCFPISKDLESYQYIANDVAIRWRAQFSLIQLGIRLT
jgi:hypothetical protein